MNLVYDDTMTEEILEHYGIKGMRWGVRRPVGPDGLVGSAKKSKTQLLKEEVKALPKTPKQIGNAIKSRNANIPKDAKEARKLATRMQKENEYVKKSPEKGILEKRSYLREVAKLSDKELDSKLEDIRAFYDYNNTKSKRASLTGAKQTIDAIKRIQTRVAISMITDSNNDLLVSAIEGLADGINRELSRESNTGVDPEVSKAAKERFERAAREAYKN